MDNENFGFRDDDERKAFYIALPVIALFGALLYYFVFASDEPKIGLIADGSEFIDTDADGIADHIDRCTDEHGSLANQGCLLPDTQEQDKQLHSRDQRQANTKQPRAPHTDSQPVALTDSTDVPTNAEPVQNVEQTSDEPKPAEDTLAEASPEIDVEAEAEADVEAEAEAEADADAEPLVEEKINAEPKASVDVEAQTEPVHTADAQDETEPESIEDAQAEAESEPTVDAEPKATPTPKVQPEANTDTAMTPEAEVNVEPVAEENAAEPISIPADSDANGIADEQDVCANQSGSVNLKGCPEDMDDDGIADADDKCPDIAGASANSGCPANINEASTDDTTIALTPKQPVTESEERLIQDAGFNIQFKPGVSELTGRSREILLEVAKVMQRYPEISLEAHGYTDANGSASINKGLSQTRAQACIDIIAEAGVDRTRLKAIGFGEVQPIASNQTAIGRQKNRRVEFKLIR